MKIEHLLARHLYNAKTLTLQGIGTFSLPADFVLPGENDKITEIPQGAISFTQNAKATEDADLINFIVQHSRKMKALASSDLDSFISLGTQFLNIGKPFKLEGIGMLEKNQLGEYLFTQYGQIVSAKAEEAPVQIKEKREETVTFTESRAKTAVNPKKALLAVLGIVIVGAIISAVVYFFINRETTSATEAPQQAATPVAVANNDTAKKENTTPALQKPDSSATNLAQTNSGYTFKVVLKSYPTLVQAQKAFERLSSYGHKPLMYTSDSTVFKIAIPLTLPLRDTTYAKDSLRKFFNAKTYVELK